VISFWPILALFEVFTYLIIQCEHRGNAKKKITVLKKCSFRWFRNYTLRLNNFNVHSSQFWRIRFKSSEFFFNSFKLSERYNGRRRRTSTEVLSVQYAFCAFRCCSVLHHRVERQLQKTVSVGFSRFTVGTWNTVDGFSYYRFQFENASGGSISRGITSRRGSSAAVWMKHDGRRDSYTWSRNQYSDKRPTKHIKRHYVTRERNAPVKGFFEHTFFVRLRCGPLCKRSVACRYFETTEMFRSSLSDGMVDAKRFRVRKIKRLPGKTI